MVRRLRLLLDDEPDSGLLLAADVELHESRNDLDLSGFVLFDQASSDGDRFHGLVDGAGADRMEFDDTVLLQRPCDGAGDGIGVRTGSDLQDLHASPRVICDVSQSGAASILSVFPRVNCCENLWASYGEDVSTM